MKTVDQVMTWLVYQGIYNKVIKYLKDNGTTLEEALKEEGENLLLNGVCWVNTKESDASWEKSVAFWEEKNMLFKRFYCSPKTFVCFHEAIVVATIWKQDDMKVTEEQLLAKCPEADYAIIDDEVCYLYKTGITISEI